MPDQVTSVSVNASRMQNIFPSRGLYAITPQHTGTPETLAEAVCAAIRGGAQVIQYRAKNSPLMSEQAECILSECRRTGVPLVINDDMELMQRVGADGIHLGRDDMPLAEARRRLGATALIGVSCYDSIERALEAQAMGASYVAFGRFFPSQTKPQAPCAQLETLKLAKRRLHIPIVAIGGITAGNGQKLIDAGADLLAVVDGIFGEKDIARAAASIQRLFLKPE